MRKHHVLVVGGGYAGVKAALDLSLHDRIDTTVLSDATHLRHYPTLYRTATGGSPAQSSIPLSSLFEDRNIRLEQGSAEILDRTKKAIVTHDGRRFGYDTLVLTLGSVNDFQGITGLAEHAFTLASTESLQRLKNHIHEQLQETGQADNYIVVGGGPTGVELAGALPDYLRTVMHNHGIRSRKPQVSIIEAEKRLLPTMPKAAAQAVRSRLRELGVSVYLHQPVQGASADALHVKGRSVESHTIIWTTGVTNHSFFSQNGFRLSPRGKVVVDDMLLAENNVFVIGDNAETFHTGTVQTALHTASHVASTIHRRLDHKPLRSYASAVPWTVIPVGSGWACVQRGSLIISGRLGWSIREWNEYHTFRALEPWNSATRQWLYDFSSQEDCPTCAVAQ